MQRDLPKFEDAYRQAETNANLSNERVREIEMLARDIKENLI